MPFTTLPSAQIAEWCDIYVIKQDSDCTGRNASSCCLAISTPACLLCLYHVTEDGPTARETVLLLHSTAQSKDANVSIVSCLDPCAYFIVIFRMPTEFHGRLQLLSYYSMGLLCERLRW